MIAIVDYEAGNLTSVQTALSHLGARFAVTSRPEEVLRSDKVIFPGVGEACQSMSVLRSTGLYEALRGFADSGRPLLGICLGCQILQEHSEERNTPLLGLIPGTARLFPGGEGIKVPQIGWNTVTHNGSKLFEGIPQKSSFYFVHSYYLSTRLPGGKASPWVIGTAEHGLMFTAALNRENIWGTQFHPEKSGSKGLALLKNFIERIG